MSSGHSSNLSCQRKRFARTAEADLGKMIGRSLTAYYGFFALVPLGKTFQSDILPIKPVIEGFKVG